MIFFYTFAAFFGEMPEWSIGAVSKTVVPFTGTQGSNPCLSAEKEKNTNLKDGIFDDQIKSEWTGIQFQKMFIGEIVNVWVK